LKISARLIFCAGASEDRAEREKPALNDEGDSVRKAAAEAIERLEKAIKAAPAARDAGS